MKNAELSQVYLQFKENTKHYKASRHTELCLKSGSLGSELKCFKEAASLSELTTMLYEHLKINSPRQQIF